MTKVYLVVILVAILATALSLPTWAQGAMGTATSVEVESSISTNNTAAKPPVQVAAAPVDNSPVWESRDGRQEAPEKILSDKDTISVDRVNARVGHFKEVYIGGRKVRLDLQAGRPRKRLSTAAARKANEARVLAIIGSRAVKAHWVGKGYVDDRDAAVFSGAVSESKDYTDKQVGDLSDKTDRQIRRLSNGVASFAWTKLAVIIALILALVAAVFAYKAYKVAKNHCHGDQPPINPNEEEEESPERRGRRTEDEFWNRSPFGEPPPPPGRGEDLEIPTFLRRDPFLREEARPPVQSEPIEVKLTADPPEKDILSAEADPNRV